jgi:hypothetical protein
MFIHYEKEIFTPSVVHPFFFCHKKKKKKLPPIIIPFCSFDPGTGFFFCFALLLANKVEG